MQETAPVGKPGVMFEVWGKWKKKCRKLGPLMESVGGLRWWPHKAPTYRQRNWDELAKWFEET